MEKVCEILISEKVQDLLDKIYSNRVLANWFAKRESLKYFTNQGVEFFNNIDKKSYRRLIVEPFIFFYLVDNENNRILIIDGYYDKQNYQKIYKLS